MTILKYFYLYLATIPVFFLIDLFWLGVIAKGFYDKQLGSILAQNINWVAALIFYLLYIVGIIIFAVHPALGQNSLKHAAIFGGLFGFFCYATYDLSNLATLKDWPKTVVAVDIIWGTILTALVATLSFLIARHLIA